MEEVSVEKKVPLVLLSGGLDSTYALYLEMVKGDCDVLYVETNVADHKLKAEKLVRENLISIIEKLTGNHVLQKHTVNVKETYQYGIVDSAFQQPIMWLTGAMVKVCPRRHNKVVIAYVAGDQILAELANVNLAWQALGAITKKSEVPPLEFPLRYHTKLLLLEDMPQDLVGKTWTCETPRNHIDGDGNVVYDECGFCIPCLTQYGALQVYEKKHRKPYKTGEHFVLTPPPPPMVEPEITEDDVKEIA
jgi:7-cyano-7-deazaguanine synthase in queuosine biosynthesis